MNTNDKKNDTQQISSDDLDAVVGGATDPSDSSTTSTGTATGGGTGTGTGDATKQWGICVGTFSSSSS